MALPDDRAGGPGSVPAVLKFPIVTERFTLSVLSRADRTAFTAYRRDPNVARFQSWTPGWSDADTDALIADQRRSCSQARATGSKSQSTNEIPRHSSATPRCTPSRISQTPMNSA